MSVPVIYFDLGNTLVYGPSDNRQLFGDAAATIQELWQRGYRIGLLSDQLPGTTEEQVRQNLDSYGLQSSLFDVITISSEFDPPIFKPDAAIFEAAVAKAGHTDASDDTVFITETLGHIEAARVLGWRSIHKPFEEPCTPQSGECIEDLDDLLALFTPLPVDIWIRDAAGDPGDDQYAESNFWNSPDLWIRNQPDGGTTHQSPEVGQDNWFYTRLRNRGVGIARIPWLGYRVQEWVGTQFVYPDDYMPYINTSEFTPFAFGLNIDPGESRIVSGKWPAEEVPPAGTHACWLAAAHISGDMPASGAHIWEHNNLAQKNLTIVDLVPDDSDGISVVLGNRAIKKARYYRLELYHARKARPMEVSLHGQTRNALAKLVAAGREFGREPAAPDAVSSDVGRRLAQAKLVDDKEVGSSIVFDPERASGIGIALRAGQIVRTILRFTIPREAKPDEQIDFNLVQRGDDGQIVGGITVRVNVQTRRNSSVKPPPKAVRE